MKNFSFTFIVSIIFIILIITFSFYRVINLGYNSFTGDETNTLRFVSDYNNNLNFYDFVGFLQKQERGPGQYVINYLNYSLFGFNNELQFRIPYLVASLISIYLFYLLVKKLHKHSLTPLILTLIFSFNGLFIVFSRITQYQSFIILLIILSLLFFLYYNNTLNAKYLIFSLFFFSLSVFFHLDALSYIAFFISFFFYKLFLVRKSKLNIIITFLILMLGVMLVLVTFLLIGGNSSTLNYLQGRVLGGGFMPKTPYFELGLILEMYMPLEVWIILFLASSTSLFYFIKYVSDINLKFLIIKARITKGLFIISIILFKIGFFISLLVLKPRLSTFIVYFSSFSILMLLLISKKVKPLPYALVFWFLTTFCVYFFFLKDPRTHVYVVFIPLLLVISYLIDYMINKSNFLKHLIIILTISVSFYLVGYYYLIFVDKSSEFLLFPKSYLGKNLPYENRAVKSSRKIFGITTNNHLMEIRDLYKRGCLIGTYTSNEKDTVTNFYLSRVRVELYTAKNNTYADNIIFIEYPTSWGSKITKEYLDSLETYINLKEYTNLSGSKVIIYGKKTIYLSNRLLCN